MKVTVDLEGLELKNNGIIIHVKDNSGRHVGDLRLGQASGEWRPSRRRTGVKFEMSELVEVLEDWFDNQ